MDTNVFEGVQSRISGITTGFLAPIFLASTGLHLDVAAFTTITMFMVVLIAAAVLCKLIGAGLPAYWTGLPGKDALIIGVGMRGREAVEFIVADIALRAGLFSHPDPALPIVPNLFSAIVITAVVTMLMTPIGLRLIASDESQGFTQPRSGLPVFVLSVSNHRRFGVVALFDCSNRHPSLKRF